MQEQPRTWGKYFHWAEWHYNSTIHSTTGTSPFHIVYGKPPPSLPHYIRGTIHIEVVDASLAQREELHILLNLESMFLLK